jgi:hypothetical protein
MKYNLFFNFVFQLARTKSAMLNPALLLEQAIEEEREKHAETEYMVINIYI